jgi:hypothetical protein
VASPNPATPLAAGTSPPDSNDDGGKFIAVVRVVLAVLGFVSFLCVLAIGFFTISPSALPDSLRATCVSEQHSEHQRGLEDKDENGLPDFPTVSQSGTDNRKCEAQQIPTELLICATALTAFFFLGISAQLLRGVKIKAKDFEFEGPPSQLGVDTARATAAGAAEFPIQDRD